MVLCRAREGRGKVVERSAALEEARFVDLDWDVVHCRQLGVGGPLNPASNIAVLLHVGFKIELETNTAMFFRRVRCLAVSVSPQFVCPTLDLDDLLRVPL